MKSLTTICSMLLALACFGNEPFQIDFRNPDSITIKNTGEDEITLSGRFLGKDRAFVPSLYAGKKVNGEWESYPLDWCGTGRKIHTIQSDESFTFPYQYHKAIGHVKIHILGKKYEFENSEGHELPTPNETIRKAQLIAQFSIYTSMTISGHTNSLSMESIKIGSALCPNTSKNCLKSKRDHFLETHLS